MSARPTYSLTLRGAQPMRFFRSPAWRKRLSDEQSHASLEVDLRAKLGGELFELLHAVANRLETHEHRGVALAYLVERLKHAED